MLEIGDDRLVQIETDNPMARLRMSSIAVAGEAGTSSAVVEALAASAQTMVR